MLIHCEEIFPYLTRIFLAATCDYQVFIGLPEKNCQVSSGTLKTCEHLNRILGLLANAVLHEHKSYCWPDPSYSSAWDSPVPPMYCCFILSLPGYLLQCAALHHLYLPLEHKIVFRMGSFNNCLVQIDEASGVSCKMFAFKQNI